MLFEPLMAVHFGVPLDALLGQLLERRYHLFFDVVEPVLDLAVGFDILFEFEIFVLGRNHAHHKGGGGKH